MNLPLVQSSIFKKIEYLELILEYEKQDKLQKRYNDDNDNDNDTQEAIPTWELEKRILHWTYLGHKHLSSSIKSGTHFNYWKENKEKNTECKLNDWLIEGRQLAEVSGGPLTIMKNMVMKGLAQQPSPSHAEWIITTEGLMVGALLWKYSKTTKQGQLKMHSMVVMGYYSLIIGVYGFYAVLGAVVTSQALKVFSVNNSIIDSSHSLSWLPEAVTVVMLLILVAFIFGIGLTSGYFTSAKRRLVAMKKSKLYITQSNDKFYIEHKK